MSGHSKWSTIKRAKGAADAKRGKLFTKIIREIQVSARIGGGDIRGNARLRDAMAEARANNMPKENIDRAVKRGTGELEGAEFEQITYEGYGPGGTAILIESLTDNRNRTVADLRALMTRNGGNLAEAGSVAWMFEKKGLISIGKNMAPEDRVMEVALESGADDIRDEDSTWDILTSPSQLETVKAAIEGAKIPINNASLSAIPKNTVSLNGEDASKMLKLVDALEDMDDVQKVHANFDISDDELKQLASKSD
ncbi:MAG: transcriptional regulator [Bdellovibrionales bacterium RIFOXYD1_FULL_44_7]|nr:MAG: transcriptional regulator [Bdellovibrionales bacterium RIFOXYD1_FULL_44_7]